MNQYKMYLKAKFMRILESYFTQSALKISVLMQRHLRNVHDDVSFIYCNILLQHEGNLKWQWNQFKLNVFLVIQNMRELAMIKLD